MTAFRWFARARPRRGLFALLPAALFAALAMAPPSAAQDAKSLPTFSACQPGTVPQLPERWRATALLIPFLRQQIDVGEFVYDGSLPAMRATVYGLESGAVDLLITEGETYQLGGPAEAPDSCVSLGHKYSPPARQWLGNGAVCDGEAAIANKNVQWWKTPTPDGRTNWQWYAADTRLPWRVLMANKSFTPAVIGDYGMSYFPSFTPVAATELARLRDLCAAKAQKATGAAKTALTARDLMTIAPDIGAAERAKKIQALMPGVSQKACPAGPPPRWPDNFVVTGILSPVQFKWTPLPGLLFYDWQDAGTLFAYLYQARSAPPAVEIISVLTKGIGYSVERLGKRPVGMRGESARRVAAGLDGERRLRMQGGDRAQSRPRHQRGKLHPRLPDQGARLAHDLELVLRQRHAHFVCRAGRDQRRTEYRRLSPLVAGRQDGARDVRGAGTVHARGRTRPAAGRPRADRDRRISLLGLSRHPALGRETMPQCEADVSRSSSVQTSSRL